MKRILSLIGVVLVVGCGEPVPRNVDELVIQGRTYLDGETMEPYSGPVFELFSENPSKIQDRFNLKDGEKDGPVESYHDNGEVSSKGTYKDGEYDGVWESYSDEGQLWYKTTYKNGERDGLSEMYRDNGEVWSKTTYKNGVLDGLWESYYQNGEVWTKGTYKDGEKCGEWLEGYLLTDINYFEEGETVTYDLPC